MPYVGFLKRMYAALIDLAIIGFPYLIIINSYINVYFFALFTIGVLCYFTILPATNFQGTIGKFILGLKIVDEKEKKITIFRSLLRLLSQFLSSYLFIGYLMITWTKRKRGLHDYIARTYVIQKNS